MSPISTSASSSRRSCRALVKYDNIDEGAGWPRKTRSVAWLKAAQYEFEKFPEGARMVCLTALTIAAEGGKADIAKPLQGVGSGILEVDVPFKGDVFRVVYALQLGPDIWVID